MVKKYSASDMILDIVKASTIAIGGFLIINVFLSAF